MEILTFNQKGLSARDIGGMIDALFPASIIAGAISETYSSGELALIKDTDTRHNNDVATALAANASNTSTTSQTTKGVIHDRKAFKYKIE